MTNDAPSITLRISRDGQPDETLTFSGTRVLIGRETGDVVLRDPESSALHAELDCSTGAVVVRDLGSSNGTWRDGQRLPQFALFVGQSFRCGNTTLTLLSSATSTGATPGRTLISKDRKPPVVTDIGIGPRPSNEGTLPGEPRSNAPVLQASTSTVPFVGPPPVTMPALGESAPVLHRDTQTGPPEAPAPVDTTLIAPVSNTTLLAPVPSTTLVAPIVHNTEPSIHVAAAPVAAAPLAAAAAPAFRPPVKNALIKPGGAGASTGSTGPVPVVTGPRRRGLWLAGKIALAVALFVGLGGAIWWAVVAFQHRAPALASVIARELPDSSLGFVAIAAPRTQLELFGEEVPTETREEAKRALGFDPFTLSEWETRGVDVDAPIGIGLLGVDPPTVAVSIGMKDPAKLREALPAMIGSVTGLPPPAVTDRSFGEVEGLWLESPKPTAVLLQGKRLVAIFGVEQAEASVVSHHAEKLAKLERGHTLADRPGFEQLVREPGDAVMFVYMDGISARTAVPLGQAALVGVRMAFAEIDAAALVLSRDGPRLHLGTQTVLREGSQARQYVADIERTGKLPDRVPGPAIAAADLAFASEPAIQAIVSFASLAGVWNEVEGEFRKSTQLDLRADVLDNLSGELGWALHRLPSKIGADDFATLVYIGVKDGDKATQALTKLVGQVPASYGLPVPSLEKVGSTDVHVVASPVKVQVFVAHGAVWAAFGGTDAREVIDGPAKNLRAAARIDPIKDSLAPGGTLGGYFDIREFVKALDPLLDEDDRKKKAEVDPILAPLEALTARSETKDRTAIFRITLHTSGEDALGDLVRSTMKVAGEQFARSLQRAQRVDRCAKLTAHLIELAKTDTSRSIPEFELRYDLQDKCIDKASIPAIDCALAATTYAGVARCAEGDVSLLPEEPEPSAVPYIDDIWPNTKSEPSDSGRPRSDVNYAVDIGPEPQTRGNADALVTIIEFGDFQCPHCRQVASTVDQVLSRHGPEVRVVFRHLPLAMHPEAKNAARAALAAARQEKFWEMHDKLFDRQFELAPDKYKVYAGEIGLDVPKFETDFEDPDIARRVDEDMAVAARFGATGTPSFFINGRFMSGAQPVEAFEAIVKEEMERARRFVERRGHTRKRLYEDMTSRFAGEVQKASAAPLPPDTGERFKISTEGLPKKGASAFARISVVECGDFDCPYCQRATKTIDRVIADYPTQVSFYFLHNPLAFHPNAESAARAAAAADKQGKFWEMHDKLFADQESRTEADFIRFATELKLDADKFKIDFAAAETAKTVADQKKICSDNRATGTPSFFVNGRLVEGAQPYDTFRAILDAELAGGI